MSKTAPVLAARPDPLERTRQRILAGALRAIARHGLAKLGMSDVSAAAGVSRGTLYRYFPTREALLEDLAAHVQEKLVADLQVAPAVRGNLESRLLASIRQVTTQIARDPAIRRLIETEPAFVLAYAQERRSAIRAVVDRLLAPPFVPNTRRKLDASLRRDLSEWLARALVSAVLFPDPDGEGLARSLHRVLAAALEGGAR